MSKKIETRLIIRYVLDQIYNLIDHSDSYMFNIHKPETDDFVVISEDAIKQRACMYDILEDIQFEDNVYHWDDILSSIHDQLKEEIENETFYSDRT